MSRLIGTVLTFLFGLAYAGQAVFAASLHAAPPIEVPGGAGKFDFMAFDNAKDRVLAAHTGILELAVLTSGSKSVLPSQKIGAVQGVAIDEKGGRYFAGDEKEKKIVILDSTSFVVLGEIAVGGPVDSMAYDSKRGLLYVDEDDGDRVWVIDPNTKKIVTTIAIPGAPEVITYDMKSDRLYQNIKTTNQILVINPETKTIIATWSTLPATSPHGLAIDSERGLIFSAGKNGKLIEIDMKTGKLLASTTIPESPDQIGFDPQNRIIYSACRGFLSAVRETDQGLETLEKFPSPKGAHTLAIDEKRSEVWLAYTDGKKSYFKMYNFLPKGRK